MNTSRAPSISDAIADAIRARVVNIHTMLPGKIAKYDAAQGTVDVDLTMTQPRRQPDNTIVAKQIPRLLNVPVAFPRCAAGYITFPLAVDDLVMVHFAEQDLGDWARSGAGQLVTATVSGSHPLSGAVAYPGGYPVTSPIMPTPSTANVVVHASGELHLGRQDPSEYVALATKTLTELNNLVTYLTSHTHPTGMGPSGPPLTPPTQAQSVAAEITKAF